MFAQSLGSGQHLKISAPGLGAPGLGAPKLGSRPASRILTSRRTIASADGSQHSDAVTVQGRVLGLGLGLALTLGINAAPATADTVQDIQKIAGNTTVGQTAQKLAAGNNPFQGVQDAAGSAKNAAGSAKSALPSQAPSLSLPSLPEGPSVGSSLTKAFTTSPPQISGKGKVSAAAPADFIRGRFGSAAGLIGVVALALGSSLLAAPAVKSGKANPKAAAKGAKSQARKVGGSGPFQAAKQLGSQVRSKGTQKLSKGTQKVSKQGGSPQPSFGSQLNRVKSAGKGSLGKAQSAAKQAQQKTGAPQVGGGLAAGGAAALLLVGGLIFAVISKPEAPSLPSPDDVANPAALQKSAPGSAAPNDEAAAHKSSGAPGDLAANPLIVDAPPQKPQGSTFDLSLGKGGGPNSEPLNLRPSVEGINAPKPGGIPVFPPKGTEQEKAGTSAEPAEEASVTKSIVKPGGQEPSSPQSSIQPTMAVPPQRPQGDTFELSLLDFDGASLQQVFDRQDSANPLVSKGKPDQSSTTDQSLNANGPAAEAQRDADESRLSRSDEQRLDRDT